MQAFDIAAILIAVAAVSGYINHRLLKLPATSGTLVVSLISSLIVVAADRLYPPLDLLGPVAAFLARIDFDQTVMHGMLCFLLFAGALHVDREGLLENKWTIAALSTVGVLLSTAIVGVLRGLPSTPSPSTYRCLSRSSSARSSRRPTRLPSWVC